MASILHLRFWRTTSFVVFGAVFVAALLVIGGRQAAAANPATISFQGKVTNPDGTNVADGSYSFSFRVYSGVNPNTYNPNLASCTADSNCKWQETEASVQVTSGIFQVQLGSACALTSVSCSNSAGGPLPSNWSNGDLYLTMQFNGDSAGYMTPLNQFQSVPFAFNASDLGGLAPSGFVQLAQGVQTDSSSVSSIFVNKTGSTGDILELQKGGVDVVAVSNAGALLLGQQGTGGLNGSLAFNTNNAANTAITIQAPSGVGTSYSLTLPTALPAASNYCLVSTNLGVVSFSACGAGSTASVTLAPEFIGAVMTGDGTNNSGTMTSDFCSGSSRQNINTAVCNNSTESHNYYAWTSTGANDYDVWVRWQAPSDFASFSSGSFYGWRTASGDGVTMNVYNNSASSCASQSLSGSTGAWVSQSVTLTGCTPSPGNVLTIDIHLAVGASGDYARIGELSLTYNRN